jgi:hypothetical protein
MADQINPIAAHIKLAAAQTKSPAQPNKVSSCSYKSLATQI